ncbi:MAG TPA: AMP-binding protein, partial [Opitutaceae bacterium]|nr:AMP-binding protein [Opitutaceae bacterium]
QILAEAKLAQSEKSKIEKRKSENEQGWLMIASGGTSGQLKFARHDQDTLRAAVDGFSAHFNVSRVNAVGVLPLHHVSGLMAWMRCALTGGKFLPSSWPEIEAGRRPAMSDGGEWFLSLVPTQLQRLLAQPEAIGWLRRFRTVFLGGGPAWPDLLDRAAEARVPLAPSYGLTETAAMVATLRPQEFLDGSRSSGAAMPHVRIDVTGEGTLRIAGESVFRGYFPEWRAERDFTTDDLGFIDGNGQVQVTGRRDGIIITGGKKVSPTEVEAALRATGEFEDVAVLGVPDAEWGEAVVACYPATTRAPDLERVSHALAEQLSPPARPKRYVSVAEWPRNAQGKLNRALLAEKIKV